MTGKGITRLSEESLARVAGGNGRPDGGDASGGLGNDTLVGSERQDIISGHAGDDWLVGLGGNDLIGGGSGEDILQGGLGDDTLAGGTGADEVRGFHGNDLILWQPGEGNDTLMGEGGTDTLRLEATGLDMNALIQAIAVDPGSPQPRLVDGVLDVTGVTGTIAIGGEVLTFSGFERIELANHASWAPGR